MRNLHMAHIPSHCQGSDLQARSLTLKEQECRQPPDPGRFAEDDQDDNEEKLAGERQPNHITEDTWLGREDGMGDPEAISYLDWEALGKVPFTLCPLRHSHHTNPGAILCPPARQPTGS
ncbi:UNVERIFIED_CONTAM: hypothetical protein K2H54_060397 [Gekko kuhli]